MGLRAWICVLALTAFGAGLAGGLYAGELRAAAAVPPGSHSQAYRQMFEETFELSPERRRLFEQLLERYDAEVEEVRQRALAASITGVQEDLAGLGVRYRDAIRNHVLPLDQQEHFDRLVAQTIPPPARR
jgi:hypothetical protein